MTVSDIRNMFIYKYLNQKFDKVSYYSDKKRITILGAYFRADEPYIFREPDEKYLQAELDWYLSQSFNVKDIPNKIPKIWTKICDKDGFINSNYGALTFSPDFGSQYDSCLEALKNDPSSNHGIIITNRPSIHQEWNKNGMKDFICLNNIQFFIENKTLKVFVDFRSNDAIFGYRNDYAWVKYLADKLMLDLNDYYSSHDIDVYLYNYEIYWFAGTLHIYEDQFKDIQKYIDDHNEISEERVRQMEYELKSEYRQSMEKLEYFKKAQEEKTEKES